MGRRKADEQYQMSDNFAKHIIQYLKNNNTTLKRFCKENNLSYYFTYKIIDRKIKMHSFFSYIVLLAKKTEYDYLSSLTYIKKIG